MIRSCGLPISDIGIDVWLGNKPPNTIPVPYPLGYKCCVGHDTIPKLSVHKYARTRVENIKRTIGDRRMNEISPYMLAELENAEKAVIIEDEQHMMASEDIHMPVYVSIKKEKKVSMRNDNDDILSILDQIQEKMSQPIYNILKKKY